MGAAQNTPTIRDEIESEHRRWTEILKNTRMNVMPVGYYRNEIKETINRWCQVQNLMVVTKERLRPGQGHMANLVEENKQLQAEVYKLRSAAGRGNTKAVGSPISHTKEEVTKLKEHISDLKAKNASLDDEKQNLLLRLSKIAGERLMDNNPNIADLSDQNRPTKLGEKYSELYDNEWTDAFEALTTAGHDEEEAIETLRLTLSNIFSFCEKKADMLVNKASSAVDVLFEEYKAIVGSCHEQKPPSHLTIRRKKVIGPTFKFEDIMLHRRWRPKGKVDEAGNALAKATVISKQDEITKVKEVAEKKLKALRKDVALSMVPLVQQAYIDASWSSECIPAIKPYIRQCLNICWLMVVQSPPMAFHERDEEVKFDKNLFKEYTARGSTIRYVVWPPMLLHKEGSVVSKGVAQGADNDGVAGIQKK